MKTKTLTLLGICVSLTYPTFGEVRNWTDVQGRTLEAEYISATEQTVILNRTYDNLEFEIELSKLSIQDQDFILEKIEEEVQAEALRTHIPEMDRNTIPSFHQRDFEDRRTSTCGPTTLMEGIFWWSQTFPELLRYPKDENQSAEYIHRKLTRLCHTSNSRGTDMLRLDTGIQEYFGQLEGFNVETELNHYVTLEWLMKQQETNNIVLLSISFINPKGKHRFDIKYQHAVSFVKVDETHMTIRTFGRSYTLEISGGPPGIFDYYNGLKPIKIEKSGDGVQLMSTEFAVIEKALAITLIKK